MAGARRQRDTVTDAVPLPSAADTQAADARRQLADDLVAAAVLRGRFTLRSGAVSDYYIDKFRLTTDPRLLARLAAALAERLPAGTQRIAGTALGAVPLATALSLRTGIPSLFVRADAKAYGTGKAVEGVVATGDRVVLVEDVVTTGGAGVAALAALRETGAEIIGALCVVDREDGGAERFADAGVRLDALFTRTELGLGD